MKTNSKKRILSHKIYSRITTTEDCKCKRLIFSSTTKVEENSSYGISKLKAENVLSKLAKHNPEIQISNLRFPAYLVNGQSQTITL